MRQATPRKNPTPSVRGYFFTCIICYDVDATLLQIYKGGALYEEVSFYERVQKNQQRDVDSDEN